jgi:hypothetical protein
MAAEGTPTWAGQLQTALDLWSKGRSDLGGRGLQQVLLQLRGPENTLWRALVYNQLALLSNQMGHWQYAKEQWELSNETWRESGMQPGGSELQATLEWYFQLLSHYGFAERAETVRQLHAQKQPPLLNPWEEPADKPQLTPLSQVQTAPLRLDIPNETNYAPVGGQRVASRSLAEQSFADWDELVRQALKAAADGKLQPALAAVDKAKTLVIGKKHEQALIYNAEALCGFLAGDYSQASQARQEAVNLWLGLDESFSPYAGTNHNRFMQALNDAGQTQAANIFAQRHSQMKCPLIDPWADLESGIKTGDWEATRFNILEDWRSRVEMALRFHGRGNLLEAQKELGLLEQQMSLEQMQQCPGALLLQMQSIMAYATGDYDSAQVLFRKASTVWETLEARERHDLPYLGQLKELMTSYGLETLAEVMGERLCDPFTSYKAEHQMRQVQINDDDHDGQEHPREEWENQIREAWEMALKGRWDSARRHAAKAERKAKLLGQTDLRVCYSLNSQAVFANAAGDYSDSDELQEEAVRAWRRGSHLPAARTAYSEFCLILREAQWSGMAAILEEIWDKPVSRSAFNPALLPTDSLSKTAMKILEAVQEEEPDDGILRLPSLPRADRQQPNGLPIGKIIVSLLVLGGLVCGGLYAYEAYIKPHPAPTQKHK